MWQVSGMQKIHNRANRQITGISRRRDSDLRHAQASPRAVRTNNHAMGWNRSPSEIMAPVGSVEVSTHDTVRLACASRSLVFARDKRGPTLFSDIPIAMLIS